jgi:hypothetical protein
MSFWTGLHARLVTQRGQEPTTVGTARCAVRAAFSGATVPPAAARAGTSQRDVPANLVKPTVRKAAWVAGVLALACLSTGCSKTPASGPDFSRTNVAAVVFNGNEADLELGLKHAAWERDGQTTPSTVDGVPCRRLKLTEFDPGFVYFAIHPTFKNRSVKNVTIEVEFYDQGAGQLGLQYDASKTSRQPNAAYTYSKEIVSVTDSRLWRTASFRVRKAAFQGAQNSGADFRLWVSPPDLYVRRVTVTRNK